MVYCVVGLIWPLFSGIVPPFLNIPQFSSVVPPFILSFLQPAAICASSFTLVVICMERWDIVKRNNDSFICVFLQISFNSAPFTTKTSKLAGISFSSSFFFNPSLQLLICVTWCTSCLLAIPDVYFIKYQVDFFFPPTV